MGCKPSRIIPVDPDVENLDSAIPEEEDPREKELHQSWSSAPKTTSDLSVPQPYESPHNLLNEPVSIPDNLQTPPRSVSSKCSTRSQNDSVLDQPKTGVLNCSGITFRQNSQNIISSPSSYRLSLLSCESKQQTNLFDTEFISYFLTLSFNIPLFFHPANIYINKIPCIARLLF